VSACRAVVAIAITALAPLGPGGCSTCRPDEPVARPSVSARHSGGANAYENDARVELEVSNLLCRRPAEPRTSEDGAQ
jgi:hypothetical protein